MSVGFASSENEVDVESLRARLHKMKDAELGRFMRAPEYMCSPHANFGKAPRRVFVIQLEEARKEWQRRNAEQLHCDSQARR